MAKKGQHVVPYGDGWAVRKAGSDRVTSQHSTKSAAESAGRQIAQNQKTELIVHKKDGTIQKRSSFGNDPCPPKDKK